MARRRYQNGSIRQVGTRRPKWILIYREDVVEGDAIARPQRKVELGTLEEIPTKRLARRRADEVLRAVGINDTSYRPGRLVTLEEFAERWKRDVMVHLKEGTQEKAKQHLAAHLIPAFGTTTLDRIGQEDVQQFVTRLAARMNSHSIKNVLGTLGSITKTARVWDYSVGRWHLDDLVLPRAGVKRERHFEIAEVREVLLRATQPWRAVYALGAFGALRGQEIRGLLAKDLNFKEGTLRVRQSISSTSKRSIQSVKATRSDRTIPMAPPLQAILEEHMRTTWRDNPLGLVFCTQAGRPVSHTKILEDHLHPLLDNLQIEKRGLHSFRHTATSILIDAGVPLPLVREIVGHASVSTTVGIYGHVVRPEHRAAMAKLSDALQIVFPVVTGFGGKPLQVQ